MTARKEPMSKDTSGLRKMLGDHTKRITENPAWRARIHQTTRTNPTALSNWFHRVARAGLPVPETRFVVMSDSEMAEAWKALDHAPYDIETVVGRMLAACADVGFPSFMRTDLTSNKHDWRNSCFVRDGSVGDMRNRILNLCEFSAMVDLPFDVLAAREMLPTKPMFVCHRGRMPIVREFRFFVENGSISHTQPYWPADALNGHFGEKEPADWRKRLGEASALTDSEMRELSDMALSAQSALGGDWSIDFLETDRGWYLTDMAVASESYRWTPD